MFTDDFQCPADYVKCPGSFCIPVRYMCDKALHCPNGEDERQCGNTYFFLFGLIFIHKYKETLGKTHVCD